MDRSVPTTIVPCCRSLIAVGRLAFFECVRAGFEPGELCHTSGCGCGGLRDVFSGGAPAGQCELCSLQACRGIRVNLVDGECRVAFLRGVGPWDGVRVRILVSSCRVIFHREVDFVAALEIPLWGLAFRPDNTWCLQTGTIRPGPAGR